MKREYELLSGEKIDHSILSKEEREHISTIEKLVENSADYFEVYRQIYRPLLEGRGGFNAKDLRQIYDSAGYKILVDLLERYRQKSFG